MKPEDFVGTPYRALDCFALVRTVAANCFGIHYPTLEEYNPTPSVVVAAELAGRRWLEIPYADRSPGDVMTLSPTPLSAGHVGIVLHNLWVLHNDKKYGCIIQDDVALRRRGFLHRHVYRWAT